MGIGDWGLYRQIAAVGLGQRAVGIAEDKVGGRRVDGQ